MSAKSPENVWNSIIFDKFLLNIVFDYFLGPIKELPSLGF
jgi:hypothetical protein